ncbi:MAG: glycosyltransferase family 39 protein [Chloroflexi bacterium]|nr:glycosyltransferase family 39 protein [Chloroflexota bacterium]
MTAPSPSRLAWLLAALLLLLGLGLRLYDLTDQPIDFHSTRQLRGAIIARGMYYQMLPDADPELRQQAITLWHSTGQYEPSVVEYLTARAYLLAGGEYLWLGRILVSLFWILGGVALFDLARRFLADFTQESVFARLGGALAALAYYLILPFAVQASRSFQPDPGMVMWMILGVYSFYRWMEKPSWKWAILAGLLSGVAVLTKVVAGYILGPAAVVAVLTALGWRRFWRNLQVYVMAVLMIAPTLIYYASRQGRASEYFASWTISLSHLLLDPSFYVRWLSLVQDLMGLTALLLGLVGVLLAAPRPRALLAGLWAGYFIYGLFLPYQMYTHSYYHLQLTPIVALSLAPLAHTILEQVTRQPRFWRALLAGILLVGVLYPAWLSIAEQNREDYRSEPAYWQEIAARLPTDGKIIALTQDYGYRLAYYGWRKVTLWPTRGERTLASLRGDAKQFEQYFSKRAEGKEYFLITSFGQFKDQPDLEEMLKSNYPLLAEGDGYLIYDLVAP